MIEVNDLARALLGCSIELQSTAAPPTPKDLRIEPWMRDFVKEKHSQEEWDDFFAYCESGPFRRWCINLASAFSRNR